MNEARPGHTPMTHVVVLIRVGLAFQSPLRTRHPFRMIVVHADDLRRVCFRSLESIRARAKAGGRLGESERLEDEPEGQDAEGS